MGKQNKERRSLSERFERHSVPEPNSGCTLWIGSQRRGYGQIVLDGRCIHATHVALQLAGRPLKPGQWALHHCDNRSCVNEAHLFAGSRSDNMLDALRKGRAFIPRNGGRKKKNAAQT